MLLEHKEHSCTQRCRKHYSNRGRGRNAAGAQRTLMHPDVQKTLFQQREGGNIVGAQRTFMHPEVQKTLFQQREG